MEKPKQFRRCNFTLTTEALLILKTQALNNSQTESKCLDSILINFTSGVKNGKQSKRN